MFGFRCSLFSKPPAAAAGDFIPSPDWTGPAGSGFGAPYGLAPADPVRTTGKPVCRLLTPPNQYFTDDIVIGVWAAANNAGSLASNLGLQKVVCHFEGETRDIAAPTIRTFDDTNGNPVSYLGWWVTLKKPTGTAGHAQVYFEAIPQDATMQSRVMGPYQFSPVEAIHDANIEVNSTLSVVAGSRYQSLSAAYEYMRTQAKENPLVTITGGGPYDMIIPAATYTVNNGYVTTIASVPAVIKNLTAYAGDGNNATLRPRLTRMCFRGENITFDFINSVSFYTEAGAALWLDGVKVTNSGGKYRLYRGSVPNMSNLWREFPWITECDFSFGLHYACSFASLVRGGTFTDLIGEVFDDAFCVIGTTTQGLSSENFSNDVNALTLQYTGAASTATVELSLGAGANNRVMTLRENGASIGTFTVKNTNADYLTNTNYTIANVAAWIDAFPDWTASVVDNTRAACWLGRAGESAIAFAATNAKVSLTLVATIAVHPDWYQLRVGTENAVVANNIVFGSDAQMVFLAPPTGTAVNDVIIINNTFGTMPGSVLRSQWSSKPHNHVVMAHNSWSDQSFSLRGDIALTVGSYSMIANNTLPGMVWTGTVDADLVIKDNHLQTGGVNPTNGTGTTIGGTAATLFVNSSSGDFTPAGALLANLKAPVVARDQRNTARGDTDAAGAIAI